MGSVFIGLSFLLFLTRVQKSINGNMTSGKTQLVFNTYSFRSPFPSLAPFSLPQILTHFREIQESRVFSVVTQELTAAWLAIAPHWPSVCYSQVVGHTRTRFWVQPWLGRDLFWCQSVPQQYPFARKAPIRSSSKEGGNRNSSLNKQKTNTLGLNEQNLLPCVAEKPTATLESSLDPQFQIMSEEPSSARLLAYCSSPWALF